MRVFPGNVQSTEGLARTKGRGGMTWLSLGAGMPIPPALGQRRSWSLRLWTRNVTPPALLRFWLAGGRLQDFLASLLQKLIPVINLLDLFTACQFCFSGERHRFLRSPGAPCALQVLSVTTSCVFGGGGRNNHHPEIHSQLSEEGDWLCSSFPVSPGPNCTAQL